MEVERENKSYQNINESDLVLFQQEGCIEVEIANAQEFISVKEIIITAIGTILGLIITSITNNPN